MSLPTSAELLHLEFIFNGMPFTTVESDISVGADGIHYLFNGMSFYATAPAGSPVTYNTAQFFMVF